MGRRDFFLLTSLPPLGGLGAAPPLGLAEFLARVEAGGGPRAVAAMLLLGHDLLQREALRAGELDDPERGIGGRLLFAGNIHEQGNHAKDGEGRHDKDRRIEPGEVAFAGGFWRLINAHTRLLHFVVREVPESGGCRDKKSRKGRDLFG